MSKFKRPDLQKYKKPTRILSFRSNLLYKGTGTEARDLLLKVFKQLLKGEKPSRTDIQSIVWILGDDLK